MQGVEDSDAGKELERPSFVLSRSVFDELSDLKPRICTMKACYTAPRQEPAQTHAISFISVEYVIKT